MPNNKWVAVCPLGVIGWFGTADEATGYLLDVHCTLSTKPVGRMCRRPINEHDVRKFFEKSSPSNELNQPI